LDVRWQVVDYLTLASNIVSLFAGGVFMDVIDQVRAFNRFYTKQIGLVERSYLGGGLGLSELRVLYDLAQPDPPNARFLASDLGLDEGYLSRMLAKFVQNGWLERRPDPADARKSLLKLTEEGAAQVALYADLARDSLGRILAEVNSADQARLIGAMSVIEQVMSGAVSEVELRDLQVGDAGWLIQQHGELYAVTDGFDESFEALVAEILAAFIRSHDPLNERAFIATRDGQRLGSVFCTRESDEVAKLRLFLLLPEARGLGLGRQLLEACLSFAKARGYKKLMLWTHKSHVAACALYANYGFDMTDEVPVHDFGVDLIRQNWQIDLATPLAFARPQR